MKNTTCVLFGFLALLYASPALAVPIVTSTVTDLGGGVFGYSYELTNPSGGTENIYDFGLFFQGTPDNVAAPTGWDFIAGLEFIDWFSVDPANDLLLGASLGGFSFESVVGPGEIVFTSLGADALTGDAGFPESGTTVGPNPAAVPEPGSIWLLGAGFVVLIVLRSRLNARWGQAS